MLIQTLFLTEGQVQFLDGGVPAGPSQGSGDGAAQPALQPAAVLKTNVNRGATDVPVDHRVQVSAKNGQLTSVAVSSKSGSVFRCSGILIFHGRL